MILCTARKRTCSLPQSCMLVMQEGRSSTWAQSRRRGSSTTLVVLLAVLVVRGGEVNIACTSWVEWRADTEVGWGRWGFVTEGHIKLSLR